MDLSNVIEVYETTDEEDVNRHLKVGWKLLGVCAHNYGGDVQPTYSHRYSLGWTGGPMGGAKAVHPHAD